MALQDKKYEGLHDKTGDELARIKAEFDNGIHLNLIDFPAEAALIYQMQKMQDELDALREEISANKDKAGTETTLATTSGKAVLMTVNLSRGAYSLTFTMTHGSVTKTGTVTLR
jgi:hypothetical protein